MLADCHHIVIVAVFRHSLMDGMRSFLFIRKTPDERIAVDECFVQFFPRATGKRNDMHVLIGYHHPVSQHLKRIERRIDHHLSIGKFTL